MAGAKKRGKSARKLSKRQVIDRIMQGIEAPPDAVQDLPAHMKTRKHWEKTFLPRNKRAVPMLEVLQELPAFTEQAPKTNTRAAWEKLFTPKYLGPEQVLYLLRDVEAIANFKKVLLLDPKHLMGHYNLAGISSSDFLASHNQRDFYHL